MKYRSKTKRPSPKEQEQACEIWNLKYPIGTPVTVEMDSGEIRATTTRSVAWMLGAEPSRKDPGHSAVVLMDGISGCYLLSRVRAKVNATGEVA